MKLEPRGKYAGVKVHLDGEEVQVLLAVEPAGMFTTRLVKKIRQLMEEHPDLLNERTPEQIRVELETEFKKAQQKLAKMAAGADWKAPTDEVKLVRCSTCEQVSLLENMDKFGGLPENIEPLTRAGFVGLCPRTIEDGSGYAGLCGGLCRKET